MTETDSNLTEIESRPQQQQELAKSTTTNGEGETRIPEKNSESENQGATLEMVATDCKGILE